MKTKTEMLEMLRVLLDESLPYSKRLEAYEYLSEDCEEAVEDMLAAFYAADGDTGKMLIEILSRYKGDPAIYMGLVSYLYKGDDVALFARLLGSYGDERAIDLPWSSSAATGWTTRITPTTPFTVTSKGWTSPKRTVAVPPSKGCSQAAEMRAMKRRTATAAAAMTTATMTIAAMMTAAAVTLTTKSDRLFHTSRPTPEFPGFLFGSKGGTKFARKAFPRAAAEQSRGKTARRAAVSTVITMPQSPTKG